jgi:D-glycero-beta-D-manno-heptose 1-phosphate adenylyltransferase
VGSGILGSDVSFEDRLVPSLEEMARKVEHLKGLNARVVLTSGSFDLIHLGHVKYLTRAKQLGDVLVVGVDSDAKIRGRKGPGRPMVPER